MILFRFCFNKIKSLKALLINLLVTTSDVYCLYTGCPIKNGTVDFQYIASGKLSIFLRHRIKYFPQKRMTPKSLNLMK